MSHVLHKWDMSHMNESRHMWKSHHTHTPYARGVPSFVCDDGTCHTHEHVTSHTHKVSLARTVRKRAMGWPRLAGSLKLYVSFAKETYKRDHIKPKRLIIVRGLLIIATPYNFWSGKKNMSCVTYMNESCPIWMSHVLYEWEVSIGKEPPHTHSLRNGDTILQVKIWVMSRG